MTLTKKKAKLMIENIEYDIYHGCLSVVARNVRIRKNVVLADVSLSDGTMAEKHFDCEYPMRLFEGKE